MKNRLYLLLLVLILFIIPLSTYTQEKSEKEESENEKKDEKKKEKKDEKRFQFGIGLHVNSLNFSGMSQAYQIYKAIKNGDDYSYPDISEETEESLQNLTTWMQEDILASYIIKNQEYGIHLRILWKAIIFETDFVFLPIDYTYSNRSNIMVAPMIGLRFPTFIMPYIMVGPNLNVGFQISDSGSWQDKLSTAKNSLIITPGLVLKTGIDLKAQYFSIGLYYQYRLKDFNELTYWYSLFREGLISNTDAAWNIIASQSRIGLAVSFYFF